LREFAPRLKRWLREDYDIAKWVFDADEESRRGDLSGLNLAPLWAKITALQAGLPAPLPSPTTAAAPPSRVVQRPTSPPPPPPPKLERAVSITSLLEVSSETIVKRGERYAHEGRVHGLSCVSHCTLLAQVRGTNTEPYAVRLGPDEEHQLFFSCTCPFANDGTFCSIRLSFRALRALRGYNRIEILRAKKPLADA